MKITRRMLRRIIREEKAKFTKKFDDNKKLKGDQSELPDHLQQEIIDESEDDLTKELHEVEYYGGGPAADLEPLVDDLLGILQTMDPMDRNAEIYNIIDELERLVRTGE
jgi:hypothetical protein